MTNIQIKNGKKFAYIYTICMCFSFFFFSSYISGTLDDESITSLNHIEKNPQTSSISDFSLTKNFSPNDEFFQGEEIHLTFSFSFVNSTNSFYIFSQNESKIIFGFVNNSGDEVTFRLNTANLGIITFNLTIYSNINYTGVLLDENIELQEIYSVKIIPHPPTIFQNNIFTIFSRIFLVGAIGISFSTISIFSLKKIQQGIENHLIKNVCKLFGNSKLKKEFFTLKSQDPFLNPHQLRDILKYSTDNFDQDLLKMKEIADINELNNETYWDDLLDGGGQI